jgi:hypothetical protein
MSTTQAPKASDSLQILRQSPGPAPDYPMDAEECRVLLARTSVGRVGWRSHQGQQLLPVTYAYRAGKIIFRTSPYGLLSGLIDSTEVAVEIDELDPQSRSGWSVVAHGVSRPGRWGGLPNESSASDIRPWAAGARNLTIEITVTAVTGRVFPRP